MVPASAAAPRLHNLHHTLAVREFDSPRQPKLPLGRRPSGSLLCWCKEVTKKHLESRASLGGPAQGIREGMKTPYTTRPWQTDTPFASLATEDLHAKRLALSAGTTELSWNMHPLAELCDPLAGRERKTPGCA